MSKPLVVTFHMSSGAEIRAWHVVEITMQKSAKDGDFAGYKITWVAGKEPDFFSLSLPAIVAVTAVEMLE